MDTLVAALIVADARDSTPLLRFQRAASRVEQLLIGLGYSDTAKELRKRREECGEMPVDPPREMPPEVFVYPNDPEAAAQADVLTGRKRRKAIGSA